MRSRQRHLTGSKFYELGHLEEVKVVTRFSYWNKSFRGVNTCESLSYLKRWDPRLLNKRSLIASLVFDNKATLSNCGNVLKTFETKHHWKHWCGWVHCPGYGHTSKVWACKSKMDNLQPNPTSLGVMDAVHRPNDSGCCIKQRLRYGRSTIERLWVRFTPWCHSYKAAFLPSVWHHSNVS